MDQEYTSELNDELLADLRRVFAEYLREVLGGEKAVIATDTAIFQVCELILKNNLRNREGLSVRFQASFQGLEKDALSV